MRLRNVSFRTQIHLQGLSEKLFSRLKREVVVFRKSPSGHFVPEAKTGYGIASVYTPEHKRGKGYARHMMRLLHWVIGLQATLSPSKFPEEWGLPPPIPDGFGDATVSVLYSDVGPTFYKACGPFGGDHGWTVTRQEFTDLAVDTALTKAQGMDASGAGKWVFMPTSDLEEVWKADSEALSKESPANLDASTQAAWTFLPRRGLGQFIQDRSKLAIRCMEKRPKFFGIKLGGEGDAILPFASWTLEFTKNAPKTLLITRLRCSKELIQGMLVEVAQYAKEYGIERVQIWNCPEELLDEVRTLGATVQTAHEHLSSVKWYGEEDPSSVLWLHNEK